MKSLSTLILLGTITALILGGLFVVTPALAEPSTEVVVNQALIEAPAAAEASVEAPVAPTTGGEAVPLEMANPAPSEDPGAVLGSAFLVGFEKDTASAPSEQVAPAANTQAIAPTESQTAATEAGTQSLASFAASTQNGNSSQIVGIYVENLLALQVGGQPSGNAGYISSNANEVTRFGLASDHGSQGFLAHNYLAGAQFHSLIHGQIISVVYGDGSSQDYQVQTIRRFQALSPNSTQSNFVDLDNGNGLSASELFYQMYNSENPVVLQTCIANDGVSTWGRLFVIAVPVS